MRYIACHTPFTAGGMIIHDLSIKEQIYHFSDPLIEWGECIT